MENLGLSQPGPVEACGAPWRPVPVLQHHQVQHDAMMVIFLVVLLVLPRGGGAVLAAGMGFALWSSGTCVRLLKDL